MNPFLKYYGWILIVVYAISYALLYPSTWLISDVNAYVNQAMAFAEGKLFLEWMDVTGTMDLPAHGTKYPLGNAFWLAFWIAIFGKKGAFLSGLVSVCLSALMIIRILRKELLPVWAISLLFLYTPLLFFSRTLMSSMPSLLIVSTLMYILFCFRDGGKKFFLMGLLAGISIWFRESNIMLCGPLCAWVIIRNPQTIRFVFPGFLLGIMFRLLSAWYVYGDPFFYILAEPFSLAGIANNIFVYALLLTILLPGAWIFNCYRGRYRIELISTLWVFLLFYLLYDFNATHYSGVKKGLILTGRFLIPALPLFVITMSEPLGRWIHLAKKTWFQMLLLIVTGIVIITAQWVISAEQSRHHHTVQKIEKYKDEVIFYDTRNYTNINRYINAFHGFPDKVADIRQLDNDRYVNGILSQYPRVYIIESDNTGNNEKNKRTAELHRYIENASLHYDVEEIEVISVYSNLNIHVYTLKKSN